MTEVSLTENLQQLMRMYGNPSISELARLTNVPQPTLHHILSGSTKNPRKKALESLAKFFSITPEQLIGETPLPNIIPDAVKDSLNIRTIPIIEWETIKQWPLSYTKELQFKELILDKNIAKNSFAVVMQNASMEPMFPKDAILVFDVGKSPKDRDFVLIHLAKNDSVVFNRLFIDAKEKYIKQDLQDGNVQLIKLDVAVDRVVATLAEVRVHF